MLRRDFTWADPATLTLTWADGTDHRVRVLGPAAGLAVPFAVGAAIRR